MARNSPSSGGAQESKKEDAFTVILIMLCSSGALALLVWVGTSKAIVTLWTPKLFFVARSWLWFGDVGEARFLSIRQTAIDFLSSPKEVSLIQWISYFNSSFFIVNALLAGAVSLWLLYVMLKEVESVKRTFKPQQLAQHLSHVFTGIAPVLHLRRDIALEKNKLWARQCFPHEVLMTEKIDGEPLVEIKNPDLSDSVFKKDVVHTYFTGLPKEQRMVRRDMQDLITDSNDTDAVKKKNIEKFLAQCQVRAKRLRVSRMLGNQAVNLHADRAQLKTMVFADRFSPTGKVIFGLLCAHAFGGAAGKADYAKARDQLNNSARGAANGFANLTVANWLYEKYRENATARKLFAVHYWEYTYLYELAVQAKRQGKCGHWEFIWLKPMNRILFYVMNTVGRLTPHTESAAAYAQYIYEKRISKLGRLPYVKAYDTGASGRGVQIEDESHIYIDKAVTGLSLEWDRWRDGEDDSAEWWLDADVWDRVSPASAGFASLDAGNLPPSAPN